MPTATAEITVYSETEDARRLGGVDFLFDPGRGPLELPAERIADLVAEQTGVLIDVGETVEVAQENVPLRGGGLVGEGDWTEVRHFPALPEVAVAAEVFIDAASPANRDVWVAYHPKASDRLCLVRCDDEADLVEELWKATEMTCSCPRGGCRGYRVVHGHWPSIEMVSRGAGADGRRVTLFHGKMPVAYFTRLGPAA